MNPLDRRTMFQQVAGIGVFAATTRSDEKSDAPSANNAEHAADPDRKAVLSAGMTEDEADCWKITAEAAGSFFALEELHPMDKQEVASAIHIIQNKLLSRPTYRAYRKAHKEQAEE